MSDLIKIPDEKLQKQLNSVTEFDVRNSLGREKTSFPDFINLISPAASNLIHEIKEKSSIVKKMHFGRTIRLYAPLYLSNYCINKCVYCGFRADSTNKRKRLSHDEIRKEAETIKSYGIDSVLVVTGEDPEFVSLDYLDKAVRLLRKIFSYVSLEIYPLETEGYGRLFKAGAHGLVLYQETYRKDLYGKLHSGPKKDYQFRLDSPARAAAAGFYNIGIGALLGLDNWRLEAVSLAIHATMLKKKYWKSKIQFSFPRITPIKGDFKVPNPVTEKELEQMMMAFRIAFPESDISISTRENCEFRNKVAVSCASLMSAGSCVIPGGYSSDDDGLGQFHIKDLRTVAQVEKDMKGLGLDVVFKDWDRCIGA